MSEEAIGAYSSMLDEWTEGNGPGMEVLRAAAHGIAGGEVYGKGYRLPQFKPATEDQIRVVYEDPSGGRITSEELATAMGVHAGITRQLLRGYGSYDAKTDTVLAYRGMSLDVELGNIPFHVGDEPMISNGSLSSYSTTVHIARNFASNLRHNAAVFEVRVPLKHVFIDWGDIGKGGEFEMLVFGGPPIKSKVMQIKPAVFPRKAAMEKRQERIIEIDKEEINRDWIKVLRELPKRESEEESKEETEKGSASSGYYGHLGRPGQIGGSPPRFEGHAPVQHPEDVRTPTEKAMLTGEWDLTGRLGGSHTWVMRGYIAGVGDVLMKPEVGWEPTGYSGIEDYSDGRHELAAHIINRSLGNLVDMPPAVMRDFGDISGWQSTPGHQPRKMNRTLVSVYRHDGEIPKSLETFYTASSKDIAKLGLFDAVIGNTDRHLGNMLLTPTGHLIALDHSAAFPDANYGADEGKHFTIEGRDHQLTADEVVSLVAFREQRSQVERDLGTYLTADEESAMWRRVDAMIDTGMIYDVAHQADRKVLHRPQKQVAVKIANRLLVLMDVDGQELGRVGFDGAGQVIAEGLGTDAVTIHVVDRHGKRLTPADGAAWVAAVQNEYRSGYVRAIWADEVAAVLKWEESEHPRHPAGSEEGGRFAPKGEEGIPERSKPLPAERKWIEHGVYTEGEHAGEPLPLNTFKHFRGDEEREKMRDRLANLWVGDATPNQLLPHAIVMIGGPASGKSTIIQSLSVGDYVLDDADKLQAELPEYQQALEQPGGASAKDAAVMVHNEGSELKRLVLSKSINTRRNIVLDGTGDNTDEYVQLIHRLKNSGYRVTVIATDLDWETGYERAEVRATQTGRHIPRSVFEPKYRGGRQTFLAARSMVDEMVLFDSHGRAPRLVYSRKDGIDRIKDRDYYDEYVRMAHAA
jgi:predicted ABC-type ATPase